MKKKKAYFIGIAGKAMAALAKEFKRLGWQVSGSDQKNVYPPISDYLQENNLPYFKGYSADNVPQDADLIVVGRSALMIDPQNPEFLKAKSLSCPVLSYPEVLQQYLIKKNSIVVAGTFGKTTISALLAWILEQAGFNPSYMTGGVPLNLKDGLRITKGDYSVVEGDEPPSLRETDPPKFIFYHPRYLLLTATLHDHPEIYKTPQAYQKAFVSLAKLLPDNGFLVYNLDTVSPEVVKAAHSRRISYSLTNSKADYFVKEISPDKELTLFTVQGLKESFCLSTKLLGKHNLQNICAACALAAELRIKKELITRAVASFLGIKTHLEFLGKPGGRYLYWDLAQHPSKVKGSLEALKEHFSQNRLICVFHPAMSGLKRFESLAWYPGAFDAADQVIVAKVGFIKGVGAKRVTGSAIVKAISQTQKNVFYQPIDQKIIDYLLAKTKKGEVIVFMSSGGLRFTNLIKDTIKKLKKLTELKI